MTGLPPSDKFRRPWSQIRAGERQRAPLWARAFLREWGVHAFCFKFDDDPCRRSRHSTCATKSGTPRRHVYGPCCGVAERRNDRTERRLLAPLLPATWRPESHQALFTTATVKEENYEQTAFRFGRRRARAFATSPQRRRWPARELLRGESHGRRPQSASLDRARRAPLAPLHRRSFKQPERKVGRADLDELHSQRLQGHGHRLPALDARGLARTRPVQEKSERPAKIPAGRQLI